MELVLPQKYNKSDWNFTRGVQNIAKITTIVSFQRCSVCEILDSMDHNFCMFYKLTQK